MCYNVNVAKIIGIRRDIEVVITGLTRNFVVILELSASNPLIYKGFPQFKYNLIR